MTATILAASRAVFSSAAKTLTLATPAAQKGDVLAILVARNAADTRAPAPAGWTLATSLGAAADVMDVYVRMVDRNEPVSVVLSLPTVGSEWQGELLAIRGTSPGIAVENAASQGFAATTAPTTASIASQQATSLILAVWTCSGAPALALPSGFASIDNLTTAVVSARSMLIGYQLAGATGLLTFPTATAAINATGRSFTFAVRDRVPIQPPALTDLVPGNLGLIGKDTRPAR
jgi:hypothetical protein